jgi:predicted membrane-bound mannosyltransferase/DNA-binding beta-propeller fold protein YncE
MKKFLDQPIDKFIKKIKVDHIIILLLVIFAILTRFPGLGDRVMSHDEVNHVVPSFDLYSGKGYRHDPVTHGPLQFHLISFSYFLFGDSDFASRVPHAIFSVLTIAFVAIFFRRYLGKIGAFAAGFFFLISPFMMFYGRYSRNEAICVFLNVVALYAVLRFLEENRSKFLFLVTVALSLNFTSKETAYIFTAQLLIFLFILAIRDITRANWIEKSDKFKFLFTNSLLVILIAGLTAASVFFANNTFRKIADGRLTLGYLNFQTNVDISTSLNTIGTALRISIPIIVPLVLVLIFFQVLRRRINWEILEFSNAFYLMLMTATFVLPLLAPFLVRFAGADPSAYTDPFALLLDYIYIAYLFGLSAAISFRLDENNWWKYLLTFFGIYAIFYTTFFTNAAGIMTGMAGSLGHWLTQQDIQRGGQPYYYYFLIQLPIYEYLSGFGSLIAFAIGIKRKSFWMNFQLEEKYDEPSSAARTIIHLPVPAIFIFWTITSLTAYTFAGEKMPWLTLHIAFSMLLTAGWAFNFLYQKIKSTFENSSQLIRSSIIITGLMISLAVLMLSILGEHPPFQGNTTQQLQDTNHFIFFVLIVSGFSYLAYREYIPNGLKKFGYQALVILFGLLSFLTFRSAYQAVFINYDYPLEFLVYAHAADGPKIILDQIETISRRTTQGLGIKVAYDNHGLYPYWWYLRNYPNRIVYLENPTRSLEEAPLIITGSDKYAKLEPIVRDNYIENEYMRLWWPMQDYWNLTWERVGDALSSGQKRQALFNIWLNRDYELYAQLNGNEFLTLENWLPSEKMKFYIRKDIAAQMWDFTTGTDFKFDYEEESYASILISRQPDYFISRSGMTAGDLNSPRGLDFAPDGSIFVADSLNHRIQQFSPTGEVLNTWGSYANVLENEAPGGTFHEPWDVAVSSDGFVFVADTFNHRIQKFTLNGRFLKSWGVFAQGDQPDSFWGPRGIAIDPKGRIFVTDTGNKRVVVFDKDLNYITQFGGTGYEAGQFDEPVGITIDESGKVFIADTWNRRVQIFQESASGAGYMQVGEFEVDGWYGQSIDNKPYIAVSPTGTVFITDPEVGRILEFTENGDILQGWQDLAITDDLLSNPYGLVFDSDGNLWSADGLGNIIMRFDLQ